MCRALQQYYEYAVQLMLRHVDHLGSCASRTNQKRPLAAMAYLSDRRHTKRGRCWVRCAAHNCEAALTGGRVIHGPEDPGYLGRDRGESEQSAVAWTFR